VTLASEKTASDNSVIVHSAMTLTDASGVGAKTWTFSGAGPAWQVGLVSAFVQSQSVGGTILQEDGYMWTPDPAGRPYIMEKTTAIDQGSSNPQTAYSSQTLDQYGNVTQSVIYPYNNPDTALRTYNTTYVTASTYLSAYLYNLPVTTTLTTGGSTTTILSNQYDTSACVLAPDGAGVCGGYTPPYPSSNVPTREYDTQEGHLGALTTSVTNARGTATSYYPWGSVATVFFDNGTTATASADQTTNYAAPLSISAQSYNETIGYTAWLGVAQTTGANGEQLAMTYDGYGRPLTGTSAYSAVTSYTYATTAPFWQTETERSHDYDRRRVGARHPRCAWRFEQRSFVHGHRIRAVRLLAFGKAAEGVAALSIRFIGLGVDFIYLRWPRAHYQCGTARRGEQDLLCIRGQSDRRDRSGGKMEAVRQ